jgi:hypothetical protein
LERFSRASGCSLSHSPAARPHMSGGTTRACFARATTLKRELVCPICASRGRTAAFRTASRGRTAPRHPLRTANRGPSARATSIAAAMNTTNPGRNVPRRTCTRISPVRTPGPSAPILYASFHSRPRQQECQQKMYQQRVRTVRKRMLPDSRAMPDPA